MRLRWAVVALLAAVSGAGAQDSRTALDIARSVRSEIGAAMQRGDTAGARALVTDDFAFVHSTGNSDDWSTYVRFRARVRTDSSRVVSPSVATLQGDVVVVRNHSANSVPGRGWDEYRAVDVYTRTSDGRWRWAYHQTTRVPRTPAPATVSLKVLDDYAGIYAGANGVELGIARSDTSLVVTGRGSRMQFIPLSETTFHERTLPVFLTFIRDENGRLVAAEFLRREAVERLARKSAGVSR